MTKHSLPLKRSVPPETPIGHQPLDPPQPEAVAAAEAADYIAQMTAELAQMARAAGLNTLAYFLDMAHLEATTGLPREGRGRG